MVDTEILERPTSQDYTKESVKIVKNMKGYTWEVKTTGTGPNGLFTDADFKRLKDFQDKCKEEYGE